MARVYATRDLSMGFCLDCHQRASDLPEQRLEAAAEGHPGGRHAAAAGEMANGVDEAAQPALFGTVRVDDSFELSLGPKRHDALTTCSARHR